jgi:hypothetical protein
MTPRVVVYRFVALAALYGLFCACDWMPLEITERIVVPVIDNYADKKYEEGMKEINKPVVLPPKPAPPPPPSNCGDSPPPPQGVAFG